MPASILRLSVGLLPGLMAAWALAADPAIAPPAPLLECDFAAGLQGWQLRPGTPSQAEVIDAGAVRGRVLQLRPEGKLLGVESPPLAVGTTLSADRSYQVEAQLRSDGLQKGVFAFSMYCYDAQQRSLRQIVFASLNDKRPAHPWRRVTGRFGAGTENLLPEGTASVRLRFSFYEAGGDCRGLVLVDDVKLRPAPLPGPPGWPAEIVATLGDLQVRFESRSFWTLYRVDYRGTRLGVDRFGSHYGSVALFSGLGFVGSGHTENEDEQLRDLKLWVDGRATLVPPPAIECRTLRLEKRARLRSLSLATRIDVDSRRIVEDVRLSAEQAAAVDLVYHFMHPWTPTATEYLAELPDGSRVAGRFDGDGTQKIDKPTRWSAIYDGPSGAGAVTCVLAAPAGDDWRTRYWDKPPSYRKHYFVTNLKRTIPAGEQAHYRVAVQPFAATVEAWPGEAARVAAECFAAPQPPASDAAEK